MFFGRTLLVISLTTFLSMPVANANSQDPCNELVGKWHGTFSQSQTQCTWVATAQGSQYKDIYRLQFKLTNGWYPKGPCLDSTFILSGLCKDAKLVLDGIGPTLTGTIFGGVIGLGNNDIAITLEKSN